HQYYNKPIIGIIANSIYKVKDDFNLTYNDHDDINDSKLWAKLLSMCSNNVLSDNENFSLSLKSNVNNIFIGYDLDEKNVIDKTYKYGIFGNIGFDRVVSGKENKFGNTDTFGLGIYGTFKNKHWYVDSWLNYTCLRNIISMKNPLNYRNDALKASLEIGTRGDMYIGNMRLHASLYEQLIYSYVTNFNMESVKYFGNSNLRSRLGTNLTLFTQFKNLNPYLEFNWNYDVNLSGVEIEGKKYYYNNSKNTFELKCGLKNIDISKKLSLWANMIYHFNTNSYKAGGVEIGFLYKIR
ncbi:autotransporter domain-containing protein, partial [Streptobacillus notomytis]|uniref:autotransporter domain-containing protein n=1 Tax=Streptobacillus notomytis TaxID=1712031 RepID=UPI000A4E1295